MKYLINKTNFQVKIVPNNGTDNNIVTFCELTEAQFNEIRNYSYSSGLDIEGNPNLIYLQPVTSITEGEKGEHFNLVESIEFAVLNELIETVNSNKATLMNKDYFHNKKYKVCILDFDKFITSEYRFLLTYAMANPDVEMDNWTKINGCHQFKGEIYTNYIKGEETPDTVGTRWYTINNAVYEGTEDRVFSLQINLDK